MNKGEQSQQPNLIHAIAREISKRLKLGDGGKLDSFLSRVTKQLEKEINALTRTFGNEEFNHKNRLDDLQDKLKDANDELEAAYYGIDMDQIGTSQKEAAYVDKYLDNLDKQTLKVKGIEEEIKHETERFASYTEDNEKQIAALRVRIERIGKK